MFLIQKGVITNTKPSQLPYLDDLLWTVEDPYDYPTIDYKYDFSGYYIPYDWVYTEMLIVFCEKCGKYLTSHTLRNYNCNVDTCSCVRFYPKTRKDWRRLYIQETYAKMKEVHKEMKMYFIKKDMNTITELVIGFKTNVQINWL